MMARTQITLEPEMHRRARERAAQLGISLAAYLRRLIAKDLGERRQRVDPSIVFALGNVPSDVARDKDEMLDEAVAEEHDRSIAR